ncbi:glycosyltransferase [Methylomicrobium sp. Wu6]|uniref:glycosyltransferase n=1 Tax=Methylomicrobium sp. Wu6 TaxID=3107928 RepID=UPI002DD67DC0|nr:glycosyltransferase [Methylomicrobium sp. Wu6]MEC4747379.1 glycosyltransferase [Methylomicrobium sp. Wu6]
MKKLCFVATIPAVIQAFMKDAIRAASPRGWSTDVISSPQGAELLQNLNARFIPLAIERKISPSRDILALVQLFGWFRRERYDLVHSIMPKTGLLTMLAARIAGVPRRLHTFTGQVWATKQGWKRRFLKMFDKLIVVLATHILVDSPSQRDFLVAEGILRENQGIVLGQGSICGVDGEIFKPDAEVRERIRTQLDIGLSQPVILFLGRLNRDKGMLDLASAFVEIARKHADAVLVLVGAEEDVPYARIQEICGEYRTRLRRVSYTPNPEHYMAMADIFCLPSYREGFGQVIMEAAAAGIPAVATKIYGITDAVADQETGILYPAGNVEALILSLSRLIENSDYRRRLGNAAQARALSRFSSRQIIDETMSLYSQLLMSSEHPGSNAG